MLFRLLLQGLATNTCLSELELDISCCEVQTHTHLHIKELSKSFLKMLCVILCFRSWGRLELRWFRNTSSRPRPSAVWTCLTTVPSLILFSLPCGQHFINLPSYLPLYFCQIYYIALNDWLFHNRTRGVTGSLLTSGYKSYLTDTWRDGGIN